MESESTYICNAERQSPARVVFSVQNIDDRRSRLLSWGPCVDDGGDVRVSTPRHVHRSHRMHNDDSVVANRCYLLNLAS
jgi:hypothetical protein